MNYTGQFKQDKWLIEDYFKFKKNGYFIDLAAGDGIFLSNTYLLEKELNWNGICIEANDNSFLDLKKNRSTICDNSCVLDDDSTVNFVNHAETLLSGIENNLHSDTANHGRIFGSVSIKKTTSLNTILDKYSAPDYIDFISLDVEGSEYDILSHFFKTNKRKIKLWLVERCQEAKMIELMCTNNIKFVRYWNFDMIFELLEDSKA